MSTPVGTFTFYKGTNLTDNVGDYDTVLPTSIESYLSSKAIGARSAQAYTRISNGKGTLKVDVGASPVISKNDLMCADYLKITNGTDYENITYYCFIDDVTYVNNTVYEVSFHEDSFQTWINSATLKKAIIEREIIPPTDDTIGSRYSMIEDSIGNGDMHDNFAIDIGTLSNGKSTKGRYAVCVLSKPIGDDGEALTDTEYVQKFSTHNGRPEGLYYLITHFRNLLLNGHTVELFGLTFTANVSLDSNILLSYFVCPDFVLPDTVKDYLNDSTGRGFCFLVPQFTQVLNPGSAGVSNYKFFDYYGNTMDISTGVSTGTAGDEIIEHRYTLYLTNYVSALFGGKLQNLAITHGYVPKNNKMYASPFVNIRIKNNWGQSIDLKPEHCIGWSAERPRFSGTIRGTFSINPSIEFLPAYETDIYYKERADGTYSPVTASSAPNTSYRLSLPSEPDIPWNMQRMGEILNQNRVAMSIGALSAGMNAGMAIASGNPVTAVSGAISGVNSIANMIGTVINSAKQAPAVGSLADTGVQMRATDTDNFTIEVSSPSYYDAKKADDFFTRYGYKIGFMDTPLTTLNGRSFWSYCKTLGAKVAGNIPQYAKNKICDIYDGGVRIWNASTFLDYTQANDTGVPHWLEPEPTPDPTPGDDPDDPTPGTHAQELTANEIIDYVSGIMGPNYNAPAFALQRTILDFAFEAVGGDYDQTRRDGPGHVYDCSSLAKRAYQSAGIDIKHYNPDYPNQGTYSAAAEWNGVVVRHEDAYNITEARAGDLLFYSSRTNGRYDNITHVAIYAGVIDGNRMMIEAYSTAVGVRLTAYRSDNLVGIGKSWEQH